MFTGSVETGKRVMARAAQTLTPVSLELGGKDPMIVLADADLERAANAAVSYGMNNSGQVCISVERVYVEEPVYDEFLDRVAGKVEALRQGPPGAAGSVDVGAIIFPPQIELIEAHVRDAVAKGARVVTGGSRADGRERPLLRADRAGGGRSLDALHDRGDLRADPAGDEGRRRPGGGEARQRRAIRAPGVGVDARHAERRADRPPGRGRGLLRQRRPAQLRRARAADGGLEGLGAGLAARAGRDPQVREAAVADDHPRLRPAARAPHVPVLGRGHPPGGRRDEPARRQRGVHRRATRHPARPLRHPGPVAATAIRRGRRECRRRRRSPRVLGAGRFAPGRSGGDRGGARRVGGDRGRARRPRLAARLAGRAGDGRGGAARGPRAARPRVRRLGPRGARRHPHAARPGAVPVLRAPGPRHGAESELGRDRLSGPAAKAPGRAEAAHRAPARDAGPRR